MRLLVVLCVLLVAVTSFAGPDRAAIFADCTFHQSVVGAGVTLDTLWFTDVQANAAVGLSGGSRSFDGLAAAEISAWHPPKQVPDGSDYNGQIRKVKKPVKVALLYSRVPFTYRVWANGETPRTWFDVADTVSTGFAASVGVAGLHTSEFPCWAVVSYPDSLYVAEAGGDSVQVDVGY